MINGDAMMSQDSRIPVYIINLERDLLRRSGVADQFAALPEFRLNFLNAVDGVNIPTSALNRLVENEDWAKLRGTIGCFLSHVAAWEQVAQQEGEGFCLILEDDVDVSKLSALSNLTIPTDAELVFVNDRMSPGSSQDTPQVVGMTEALRKLDRLRTGGGSDGYLLTPSTARKLVEACQSDLYYGHLDGRLLRYTTTQQDLADVGLSTWIASVVQNHHHRRLIPKLGMLKGYTLSMGLVRHCGVDSPRDLADALHSGRRPILP
jgi:Glycosyltransferase family 25 (LPS biosynthesis protein)